MAKSFPQIPSTVWWGARKLIQDRPQAKIDDRRIEIELGVQASAARQYVSELKRLGVLDEEGRPTEAAMKWRNDNSYREGVHAFVSKAYPESLIDAVPPDPVDREKAKSWFLADGLGNGTAGNKAATYALIASPFPLRPGEKATSEGKKASPSGRRRAQSERQKNLTDAEVPPAAQTANSDRLHFPLNVNLQIHIGANASVDQIEAIFSAMQRYLGDGLVGQN
ncbi:hypothetical protein [Acuticoccus sp.]|uniref:hypothetical protein n=1 Tax=Acuticoccus sp. TaxID=1904378 RepID=UPI003B52CEF4